MLAGSAGSARGRAALTVLLSVGLSVGAAVATASGAAATGGAQPVQTAPKPKAAPLDDKLGDHDRELLAAARDKKEPQVTVLLATERGQTAQVDQDVTQLGGKVGYRDDRLGYVRATIPTASVEKAVGLAKVVKVDLKENVQRDDPRPDGAKATASEAAVAKAAAAKPVLGRQPTLNPYLPIGETGAAQIRTATPAFDGRGVTIGILDSGVDLDHPALQTTTTGERKIVDWVTAVDPLLEGDQTWRPMLTPVTGPSFAYQGVTYRAPAGSFFVSRFSEAITAPSEPAGDINRDGDTTDTFGILYRASDGAIWVDQDRTATSRTARC